MKLNRTFLTVVACIFYIAATNATVAQTNNTLSSKSKTDQWEALSTKERTLPTDRPNMPYKSEVHKAKQHKNTATATLQLDSMTYSYGGGDPEFKDSYEYDKGQVATYFYWKWNSAIEQWVISQKSEYTHDAQGNTTSRMGYFWDNYSNQWDIDYKYEVMYDAQDNVISSVEYDWNSSLNQWVPSDKFEYTYGSNQAIRTWHKWDSDMNQWKLYGKFEYTYDEQGNELLDIGIVWDSDLNEWMTPGYKYENTYDAHGNQILRVYYEFNSDLNQLVESEKYEYTYDAQDNRTSVVGYEWDIDLNQWVQYFKNKNEYTYDAQGNQTSRMGYYWDNYLNQWVKGDKYEYTYDLSYFSSDVISVTETGTVLWNVNGNIVTREKYYRWDESLSDWEEGHTHNYYYSEAKTGISEHVASTVTIYPNPAQHTLHIESSEAVEQVSVYDISGRELMQVANPAQSIDISTLANGIYLVKVRTAVGETVKKIVKQ